MGRASDKLVGKDERIASKQLFEKSGASSRLSATRSGRMSAQSDRRASSRLNDSTSAAADAKTARAEKKLSKRDRAALSKKYAAKAAALTTLAAQMAFDSADDQQSSAGSALDVAAAARSRSAADTARAKQAKASATQGPSRRRKSLAGAQKAGEKHVAKTAAAQAKEKATEVSRLSAARKYAARAAAKPASPNITARITRMFFPNKEALRRTVQRAISVIATATAAAMPFIFAGFIFLLVIAGASNNAWNTDGLSENERAVAIYLQGKGLEKVPVAAILGNMKQESGVDPEACQSTGPGRGLLQWEVGSDRFAALNALASARNKTWQDISVQLEYMWIEAPGQFDAYSPMLHTYPGGAQAGLGRSMSFTEWTGITDIAWAAESWERVYTRASAPMMGQRIAYARQYLALLNRRSGTGDTTAVINTAIAKLGAPYVFGAAGPDVFDCSGFVKWCFEQNGVDLFGARTADQIYRISTPLSASDARAGDIAVFTYGSPQLGETYGHIGIYLGDGLMIETSSPPTGVNIRPVGTNATYGRL